MDSARFSFGTMSDVNEGIFQVLLTESSFTESIKRYIDEDKPDPLVEKQIKDWSLQWQNADSTSVAAQAASHKHVSFVPTHAVVGSLEISGEYAAVQFTTECYWRGDCEHGSLFFSCLVSARFLDDDADAVLTDKSPPSKSSSTSKEQKQQSKIKRKMIQRLRDDDYIKKLMAETKEKTESTTQMELCQATIIIHTTKSILEERVHCSEEAAEAVRRAVFFSSESPLDVFDLVCRLPILPCSTLSSVLDNTKSSSKSGVSQTTTPLADRAKLRLLEDATYDACDNEEEDEIVQELNIEEGVAASNSKKRSKR